MSLGISIKEDEKKEKDKLKDISLWPREVLEKRYKKKEDFMKYLKWISIATLVFLVFLVYNYWTMSGDLLSSEDALNTCVSDAMKTCPSVNGTMPSSPSNMLVTGVTDFFKWITQIDQPYFYKIMILLGILYLIQIIFAVAMDIVEVVLLIFVLIKRGIMFIVKLFKPKKEVQNNE